MSEETDFSEVICWCHHDCCEYVMDIWSAYWTCWDDQCFECHPHYEELEFMWGDFW